MSQKFFRGMDLKAPDKNLNMGAGSQSVQTTKALVGIEKELMKKHSTVSSVKLFKLHSNNNNEGIRHKNKELER